MGQVTIYLDDDIEERMRAATQALKVSKSKWIADLIRDKLATEWPASVRELPGAWSDFPTLEEIREPQVSDDKRETL